MARAYTFINTEVRGEEDVMNSLGEIPEVIEVYGVYGVYDLIAIVETDTLNGLKDVVGNKIRRMDKVRSTLTMIVVD